MKYFKTDNSIHFFFACKTFMLIGELWKQWYLTFVQNNGTYDWWFFPFQLCNVPLYLLIALPFLKHTHMERIVYTFLMDFSLLGGIAVFFDPSGLTYDRFPLTIFSYTWHVLLIILGLRIGCMQKGNYSLKGFLLTLPLYALGCIIATILNFTCIRYGNLNLFYISPFFPMKQIVFSDISRILGHGASIFLYICATITGAFLIHILWRAFYTRHTSKKPI